MMTLRDLDDPRKSHTLILEPTPAQSEAVLMAGDIAVCYITIHEDKAVITDARTNAVLIVPLYEEEL